MSNIAIDLVRNGEVAILLVEGEKPVVAMSARQLEELILTLGELRSQMRPRVDNDFALGQSVPAVTSVTTRVETDGLEVMNIMHLRDPRFGWLHYALTPAETRGLITELEAVLGKISITQARN